MWGPVAIAAGLCFCRDTVAARPLLNDERPATPRAEGSAGAAASQAIGPPLCQLCVAPARDEPAKLSCTTAEPGALRGRDPRKR